MIAFLGQDDNLERTPWNCKRDGNGEANHVSWAEGQNVWIESLNCLVMFGGPAAGFAGCAGKGLMDQG